MKQTKTLFSILCLFGIVSVSFASYSAEEQAAYDYAYQNSITTMNSIYEANMKGNLTRVAMAKMLSNYATNVLGLKPDTSKDCYFSDVSSSLDHQYDDGVTKSCQLGLMGVGIDKFYPNGKVTRAEFGTVLSRALNAKNTTKLNQMNNASPYYSEHLKYLNEQGIMNNISNPGSFELRGRVMLMLMRSDKNYTGSEITSFDELDDVVATCHVDDMGGYDYDIHKNQFIIPYKDGYIGYNYGGNGEGRGYHLTYKSLDNPCETIATTDEIFFWHSHYKHNKETFGYDEYPDNKVYINLGLRSGIPTDEVAKVLNCVEGKDMMEDDTCKREVDKYMYNLIVGNEENEYFTKWMNKFKEDLDNNNFTPASFRAGRWNQCNERYKFEDFLQKDGKINSQLTDNERKYYNKLHYDNLHACAVEYLNN